MHNKIHKQILEVTDEQVIELPFGANILCIQVQNNKPCIWYEFDIRQKGVQKVTFLTIGTGHLFSAFQTDYIGTYQIPVGNGILVFHVYKRQ